MARIPALVGTLLVLMLTAPALHAEVYKWVDEDGTTHYTGQPPPDNEGEVIDPQVGSADAEASQAEGGDAGQGQGSDADSGDKQTVEEFCNQLREDKQLLTGGGEVKVKTGDGQLKTLSDEERQQRLERINQQLEEQCSG